MNEIEMIQMKVSGLTIDPFTNMPIVILKDIEESIALPIWVGLIEASSIATEVEQIELSRPMTHDLIKRILSELAAEVERVEIIDISDNTFFATIQVTNKKKSFTLDCRPSDALAMALRTKAPIFVSRKVIDKTRRLDENRVPPDQLKEQKWAEILENLDVEDFGKYKM